MNFFCDSKGTIFHVDPEPIYQNSTGANTIYFVGAFPSSAQVTVVYKLPNGLYTKPKLMTNVTDAVLKDIKDQYGQGFSVWKEVIGQSVTYDGNNVTYGQDFTVTENSGRVEVQFIVTASGNTNAIQLGTANSSFEVGKGVPIVPQNSVENDILAQILASLQAIEQDFSENTDDVSMLKTSVDKNSQDIAGLQETVNSHTEQISDLETNVKANTADIVKNANAIALLADVQYQSGLQVIQPISEAYTARKTANGLDILDWEGNGSTARLLTVDGDTQKTTNLFNHNSIVRLGSEAPDFAMDKNGVLTVSHGWNCEIDLPAGEYMISVEGATNTITVYGPSFERTINNFPYSSRFELSEQTKILVTCAEPSVITRLQIEKGNVATKYTPYFDGLKSVEFGGIKSIGKNLCRIEPFVLPTTVEGNKKMNRVSPIFIPAGTYYCHLVLEGYENKTMLSRTVGCYLKDKYDKLVKEVSSDGISIINDNEASRITTFNVFYNAGENISEEELLKMLGKTVKIMFNRGGEGLPYEPYVESVLSLPSAIDCGLGTTIDFENQKVTEAYGEYTFNGSEGVEHYGAYGSNGYYRYGLVGNYNMLIGSKQDGLCDRYPTDKTEWLLANTECVRFGQGNSRIYLILSQDLTADEVKQLIKGMTIRYPLATPIETPFTEEQKAVGNEYTAWKYGTEEVQGNTNSSYGIYPTLTQEYVAVIDIQDTIQDSIEESINSSIRQALQGEY